jgi:subtilisin family serine protease
MVHGYFPFFNLHPLYFFNNNPYPNDLTYHNTDNAYTTAIPTNAHTVLSSGAYNLRQCYINPRLKKVISSYEPCRLTYFTSKGPMFNGRIKPDVVSPGENVLTAHSRWNSFIGHEFILSTEYQMFSGTSASSPITAGIAALVWEKYSSWNRDSIIHRIKSTAYSDNYTSVVPNNLAGWGKTDAYKALTGLDTDLSTACNPIPCILNIPPPPPPPPPPVPPVRNNFIMYPNPSTGTVLISYTSTEPLNLRIFNVIGQEVYTTVFLPSANLLTRTLQLDHLAAGYYFFRVNGSDYSKVSTIFISR